MFCPLYEGMCNYQTQACAIFRAITKTRAYVTCKVKRKKERINNAHTKLTLLGKGFEGGELAYIGGAGGGGRGGGTIIAGIPVC